MILENSISIKLVFFLLQKL